MKKSFFSVLLIRFNGFVEKTFMASSMEMDKILVFILVVNTLSVLTFDCPLESYSFTNQDHRYSINTCGPCRNARHRPIPICHLRPLMRKLTHSKHRIQLASLTLNASAPTLPEVCNADPFNPADFRGGVSVVDTVKDSYRLLTEVALRMAIIHKKGNSYVSSDVRQPILNVLCEMRGLLHFVNVDESVYTAEYNVQFTRTGDVITFACQNLRGAVSMLDHVRHVIRTDMHNATLFL